MGALTSLLEFFRKIQNLLNSNTWILTAALEDMENSSQYLENATILSTIYDAFVPVAIGLAGFYFVLGIINEVIKETITIDGFIKGMIKLLLASIVIKNGYSALVFLFDMGYQVVASLGVTGLTEYATVATNSDYSFWNTVINGFLIVPGVLFYIVCVVVSKCVTYGRMVEAGIYITMAPFAFADIAMNGFYGDGYEFVKKFGVLVVQGMVIAISIIVVSYYCYDIRGGSTTGLVDRIVSLIIIPILMLRAMTNSKQIAQSVMGTY